MARATTHMNQVSKVQEWIDSGRAREMRLAAGLTLADAARDCEVDPGAVLKWEQRKRTPRGRNVGAYYRFLNRLEAAVGHTVTTRAAEPARV